MKKVFEGINRDILYQRCLMGSIIHAVMVGEYDLLAAAQSWDGSNYSFMDFEGVRGTISFTADQYVCVIQNFKNYITGEKEIISKLLNGAGDEICALAASEALLYLLVESDSGNTPAATAAFWGDQQNTYANAEEGDLLIDSNESILPLICSEEEARRYWINDYEMNPEQAALAEKIYQQKLHTTSRLVLDNSIKEQLKSWYENIDDCIESLSEIGIFFE